MLNTNSTSAAQSLNIANNSIKSTTDHSVNMKDSIAQEQPCIKAAADHFAKNENAMNDEQQRIKAAADHFAKNENAMNDEQQRIKAAADHFAKNENAMNDEQQRIKAAADHFAKSENAMNDEQQRIKAAADHFAKNENAMNDEQQRIKAAADHFAKSENAMNDEQQQRIKAAADHFAKSENAMNDEQQRIKAAADHSAEMEYAMEEEQKRIKVAADHSAEMEYAMEEEQKRIKVAADHWAIKDMVSRYMINNHKNGFFHKNGLSLITELYRIAAGSQVKHDVLDILSQYKFKNDILKQEELYFLSKHIDLVLTLIISHNGVTTLPSDGFIQPKEVTDFMCKIASFPENVTVYNPFAGADSYAITLPNHVVGEELNPTAWALGQIRLFANSADKRTNIALGDSFVSMQDGKKYDAIITSPAYLMDKGHRIADIIRMLYSKLNEGGKLVCIVTASFLFANDENTNSIREQLIHEKAMASVVMLPANIFTGIGVKQAAVVITKGIDNHKILFADASEYTQFAKSVYRATTFDIEHFFKDLKESVVAYPERSQEIDDTTIGAPIDYSELLKTDLTPSRYLTSKPSLGMPLSNLAYQQKETKSNEIKNGFFITPSSIPTNLHRKPYIPQNLSNTGKSSTIRSIVQVPQSAVIVAMVSGNIRTVYTEGFTGEIVFPTGFIKVLKPKEGVSAKYLAALMSSKVVTDQIKAQVAGTVIPRLNRLNLEQLFVPVHNSAEEREQFITEILSSEMSELEREKENEWNQQKREVQSTRHAMIQTLSSLSSKWERLKRFANVNDGTIHLSDIIGRINPTTVEEFMGGIEYAIDTLRRQVESFRLEKKDWGEPVDINPYEFIESYKATHLSTDFMMQNLGNDNKADIPYFTGDSDEEHSAHTDAVFTFKAPKALVERIFDNIVSNAKAHGFTPNIANPTIQFDWQTNGGKIELTIKNNGLPLKEGVSGADVLMSDFSTALKQKANDGSLHFGIGGYEIKSLMEGFGSVEVISQPDAEFPVIYKLTFNDVNFEEVNLNDE